VLLETELDDDEASGGWGTSDVTGKPLMSVIVLPSGVVTKTVWCGSVVVVVVVVVLCNDEVVDGALKYDEYKTKQMLSTAQTYFGSTVVTGVTGVGGTGVVGWAKRLWVWDKKTQFKWQVMKYVWRHLRVWWRTRTRET
jgi:hypothetical protein